MKRKKEKIEWKCLSCKRQLANEKEIYEILEELTESEKDAWKNYPYRKNCPYVLTFLPISAVCERCRHENYFVIGIHSYFKDGGSQHRYIFIQCEDKETSLKAGDVLEQIMKLKGIEERSKQILKLKQTETLLKVGDGLKQIEALKQIERECSEKLGKNNTYIS